MFRRILYQSCSNHSKTRKMHKNSTRFKKIEWRDTQKQIPDAAHRPPYGYDSMQNKWIKTKDRHTIFLKNRPKIRIQSSPPTRRYTKTLQFQHPRRQRYRNVQIQKRFLWINWYAGNIPKNKGLYTSQFGTRLSRRHNNYNQRITFGSRELDKVLTRLDKENLAISLQKCEFAVTEITWLGYKINPDGIIPTKRKTEAIIKMEPPKT